jgi:hypothetical protein
VSSPQARKGAALELLVVNYWRATISQDVDRGRAGATDDRGDVKGLPLLTVECKSYANVADGISAGFRDLPGEQANNGHRWGAVVTKRRGKGRAEDQLVAMTLDQFTDMYRMALLGAGFPAGLLRQEHP